MRKIYLLRSFINNVLLFYCLAIIFIACTKVKSETVFQSKTNLLRTPKFIRVGEPRIVKIDTCPPLFAVPVINTDSAFFNVYLGDKKQIITIRRPDITPASFFIPMYNYNMDKGLSINAIISGFEDKNGNLWFGTHGGGITRYDGKTSLTFTVAEGLGNNSIENTIQDNEGNIWFSLQGGGIAKYDGRAIINYTKKNGLLSNEVRAMMLNKNGEFLIPTREGLSKFDGLQFSNFTSSESYYNHDFLNALEDNKGNFWFGTREIGVIRYDGKVFTNYSTKQGLADNWVASSFKDHLGNLWFGTRNGELSKFNGVSFLNIYEHLGIPKTATIHSINEDVNENIWIGTYNKGADCFDGNKMINVTTKQGLSNNLIQSITKDRKGNLWFGSYGGGADCYTGNSFISFTMNEGLPDNTVRNIIEDKNGNYWFATNAGGVCRYDGSSFITYSRKQGVNNNRVNRVFEDKSGNIWFCSGGGACRFDGKSLSNFTQWQGLAYDAVRSIIQDKNGNIWFGTEMGLSKFDGNFFYNYYRAQGLPSNNIRDIIEDENGRIWLATHEGGLVLFDHNEFLVLDEGQGLVNNYIHNLSKDSKGNIWICTANGVSILRKSVIEKLANKSNLSSIKSYFENLTKENGLSDNTVFDLVEDKKGNIIMGTNLGLTIVKGGLEPEKSITPDKLEYYNWKNGYPIKDANTQSMYVDKKGIIWIGTGDMLVKFDYGAIRKDPNPLLVNIQSMKINNENLGWYNLQSTFKKDESADSSLLQSSIIIEEKIIFNKRLNNLERDSLNKKFTGIKFDSIKRFYPVPLNLELPYRFNNVTFEFGAIEPSRPEQVRYQYILEGYDKTWSPVTSNSTANFGNIDEGKYTFKVKAMSPDGVWSVPISYSFKVLPPFYRTYWAYAFYIFLFTAVLYSLYRIRIRQLEKTQSVQLKTVIATQEEERKRISRDLHDDIGTKLSALKLFLSSLKNNAEKKQYEQVELLAVNSEQLISETIKDVREMLLNLSPGILEEFGFIPAIESLVNKINQTGAIHFELTVFGFTGNLRKDYELTLYRIVQELINNILKHAEAKNVSLQIGHREGKIIIMIEDDGKGFNLNGNKNGYGLKNLDARTRLLNGVMNIDSQPGKGTSVSIEVPYKFS